VVGGGGGRLGSGGKPAALQRSEHVIKSGSIML
jgi:hypothetical protein